MMPATASNAEYANVGSTAGVRMPRTQARAS